MDNLKLTRIDFRLIHGQVMTRWVKNMILNPSWLLMTGLLRVLF